MKIRPVRDEMFLADRQADGQYDANSSFSQFCEGVWKVYRICLLFFMDVKLVFVLGREKKTTKLEAS
jgi:hypothetical protein